jgi:betaine-aldehyde dehydrogenase
MQEMYIDGKWVEALDGKSRDIINPYNQEVIAKVAEGSQKDTILAIKAARKCFDHSDWKDTSRTHRSDLLKKLSSLIKRDKEELSQLESLDTGKTLEESRWDMDDIAGIFEYYADLILKEKDEKIQSPLPHSSSILIKEPIGVCAQIMPWNYPLLQASWKMAPALAAGCTIVMKPSEITPLTTIKVCELCEEVGFPKGVVNLVMGTGKQVGNELAQNPLVDLVSFTGGVATGKKIMVAASNNVKKIALELGGKNPHIFFEDIDIDLAVDHALNGVFFHAGQICSAGTRVLVHKNIHDDFVNKLKEKMKKIKIGNGFDETTQMGPLISSDHKNKVLSFIKEGKKEGATLLVGGDVPKDENLSKGFFVNPTLFINCDEKMKVVKEEVFGPVITVEKFYDEKQVISLANDTEYGLSAGFWTNDQERIKRVSRALRFGTVWANTFNVYFTQAPWGGYKQSGIGRELGSTGLDEYLEIKHFFMDHEPEKLNWFGK